ncbi:type I-E CRISPR-associated protein Cas6/Cse3/CasE [Methylocaldum sp.]|uniref:type I-E CRISPR-associated protein Cas6/Cse3/CasE n=1 Tax=Methylocaldum sp. TaxID=1969727 RepID=UPI002D27461E|nr:type I-E CRISPR-associated protein Cas6/Cse3/CasE [Methylocaldum sp.]HYE36210.1 type I-E CRISPR-associated protein Cas6/Cse3/CasE [Methylocaldum sp.]
MSGYLHRIRLKPGLDVEQLARALPANAYAEHQLVWRWFGEGAAGRDFLFRREQQGHWPAFYVLSQREAVDLSRLWQIETRRFEPRLSQGDHLAFALRANPVKVRKISDDPKIKTRRRDDVVADLKKRRYPEKDRRPPMAEIVREAGAAWLAERAEGCGFEIASLDVDGYHQHRWYKSGAAKPITLSTLEFNGVLKIQDAERFTEKLFHGIGPAKAFGCGLLLVRRI